MAIRRNVVILVLFGLSIVTYAQDETTTPPAGCVTDTCTDATNGFKVSTDPVEYNCSSLVSAYPPFCSPDHANTVSEHCCATCCQSSCIDSSKPVPSLDMSCEEMVVADPFYCKQFKEPQFSQCCQSCQPYRDQCLDTTQEVRLGDELEPMLCADIADQWPAYCKDERLSGPDGRCCASCATADLTCVDTVGSPYTIEGVDVSCAELADGYVHFCVQDGVKDRCCKSCTPVVDAYTSQQEGNELSEEEEGLICRDTVMSFPLYRNGPLITCHDIAEQYQVYCQYSWYSGYLGRCCKTCAAIDTGCVDYPNSVLPTIPDLGKVSSCSRLASRNPYFCKVLGGQVNGGTSNYCCASCKGIDTTCMDKPGKVLSVGKGKPFPCTEISNHPVLCIEYGDMCCESCKTVDTTCTDEIDKVVQVFGVSKNLTCVEAAEKYPYMCSLPEIGADGGKCCQTCKDVDTSCTDRPGKWLELWPGKMGSCANLPNYPALCVTYGEECCVSCTGIDTTCTDAPKNVPIVDARGETIHKSCGYVAAEVAYLCLQEQYGGDGGLCCVACQTADTTCANLPGGHLEVAGKEGLMGCSGMVRSWPGMCLQEEVSGPGGSCCLQCRDVSPEDLLCVDDATFMYIPYEEAEPMNCRDLASAFGRLCVEGVNPEVLEKCCFSCTSRADLECNNNPDFSVTIKYSGVKKCRRCHCPELKEKHKKTLEAACCLVDAKDEVQANCCKECSKVNCEEVVAGLG